MLNSTQQFSDAIKAAGLIPPDAIEADGAIHRFASNGKRSRTPDGIKLFSDGIPAGSLWLTTPDGLTQTWRADVGRTLTPAEEAEAPGQAEADANTTG
jgi:putative DNA primase/helicase